MKLLSYIFSLFAVTNILLANQLNYKLDDFRNYYGSWAGAPLESLRFAKNMGYKYVLYMNGMERFKEAEGLYFVFETPEYFTYDRHLDTTKTYPKSKIVEWEKLCAIKDASKPFPHNLATGWFWDWWESDITGAIQPYKSFSVQLNFQKKEIIDRTVAMIIKKAEGIMKRNPKFKYGGCSWDVPDLTGDFYGTNPKWKRPRQVGLEYWTGKDCVSLREGETVDYKTYSEGTIRYMMALRKASRKLNPDVKFTVDPWFIYRDYVRHFEEKGFIAPEFVDARADFIMTESFADDFITDKRNFANGMINPSMVSTSSDLSAYDYPREINNIGLAASAGAWSNWFGNPCPTAKSIRDIPARMKLTRALATWENLNNTPLQKRNWNKEKLEYHSTTAGMNKDAIWAIHPENKNLYFCFTSPDGVVKIPDGFAIKNINVLDSLFGVYRWPKVKNLFIIENNEIRLKKDSEYIIGEGFTAIRKK